MDLQSRHNKVSVSCDINQSNKMKMLVSKMRRQAKVLHKTRLILLSVCQAVLIWLGLHRDKVSKRIQRTWRWGGERERDKVKKPGKRGEGRGVHMGIRRVSSSRKYFIKEGQDPGD